MDGILTAGLIGGLIGGIAGGLGVALVGALRSSTPCPACRTPLPRFRKPTSTKQAALGGWTCRQCGSQVARDGTLLAD